MGLVTKVQCADEHAQIRRSSQCLGVGHGQVDREFISDGAQRIASHRQQRIAEARGIQIGSPYGG
jgi:hypothetical protein